MHTLTDKVRQLEAVTGTSLEQSLLCCLQEQSAVFDAAVGLIEQLETSAVQRNLGDPASVGQLQKTLERIVSAQEKVASAHRRFTAQKVPPSLTLRNSLSRHEETLTRLVARINSLQHVFETIRDNMSPELDTDIRRRSMHSAYQKSLKTI